MQALPGFRDFHPEPLPSRSAWSTDLRQHIFEAWRSTARRYGFREYDGPPLEPTSLYTLKSGPEIVQQLFNFTDKGGREVALRPEMTPTLARMIAASERQYKKPIKWFAIPQLFRYEKHQKGRLREHFQFNADLFGESDPAADSELIALLIDSLRALGLTHEDFFVRISSRNAWQQFFQRSGGDPAGAHDFFRVIDKFERERPEVTDAQLTALGSSLAAVRGFIDSATPDEELSAILQGLEDRGLSRFARIDYGVIRGLDYYTGVVFEAFDKNGEFRALAGGGRYDDLISLISGGKVDLPGIGFGMGDVVLAELLHARGRVPPFSSRIDVFLLIEDPALRADSLRLAQALRDAGYAVEFSLASAKPDRQFRRALEVGAARTLRLEKDADGQVHARIRNLADRTEELLPLAEVQARFRARPQPGSIGDASA
jgi:histidyl-tRNA synthetase